MSERELGKNEVQADGVLMEQDGDRENERKFVQ